MIFLLAHLAQGEYRAFRLKITNASGQSREVVSRFDHFQYPTYFPIQASESIETVNHWLCQGPTKAFARPCEERAPASR